MNRLLAILLALGLLAGCKDPPEVPAVDDTVASAPADLPAAAPRRAEQAAVAEQPLPEAVVAAVEVAAEPLADAQEAVAAFVEPEPAPPVQNASCAAVAAELIVRWEITSPAYYDKRLRWPIWPKGSSGITWCVGYDGGHQTRNVILDDWEGHTERDRLANTAGIRGAIAGKMLPTFRDIETDYPHCVVVFETRTLVEYERLAKRTFGKNFELLDPYGCGALVSLVYNRGGSKTGDSRREIKHIADVCLEGAPDYNCIAADLRSMKRLWRGTVNERGLSARREAEALVTLSNK